MIVLIICYDRLPNLMRWLDAWVRMDTMDCRLVFVITGNVPRFDLPCGVEVIRMPNLGKDIGALQRFIVARDDYDRLFWCPDDFLPLRPDLLNCYHSADLVGTFWSTETSDHIRSGGVAVSRALARSLNFPPRLLRPRNSQESAHDSFAFEHLEYNFFKQTCDLGFTVKMADGTIPPESPNWRDVEMEYLWDTRWWLDNYACVKNYVCPF